MRKKCLEALLAGICTIGIGFSGGCGNGDSRINFTQATKGRISRAQVAAYGGENTEKPYAVYESDSYEGKLFLQYKGEEDKLELWSSPLSEYGNPLHDLKFVLAGAGEKAGGGVYNNLVVLSVYPEVISEGSNPAVYIVDFQTRADGLERVIADKNVRKFEVPYGFHAYDFCFKEAEGERVVSKDYAAIRDLSDNQHYAILNLNDGNLIDVPAGSNIVKISDGSSVVLPGLFYPRELMSELGRKGFQQYSVDFGGEDSGICFKNRRIYWYEAEK